MSFMTVSPDLHNRFIEQATWTIDARKHFINFAQLKSGSKILEAGCGTGVILDSLKTMVNGDLYGLDINPLMVNAAKKYFPDGLYASGDVHLMPYKNESFDAVVSHYLFLWLVDPIAALYEFKRVLKPGGYLAVFAEPDYGSRIDYPVELELLGKLQSESLIRSGANPDIGREMRNLMTITGWTRISQGIFGSFQPWMENLNSRSEKEILTADIDGLLPENDFQLLLNKDSFARQQQIRIEFIPTFYLWGKKPE